MPMNFPDIESLKRAAEVHNFRQPNDGELEENYRIELATHVDVIDMVEANEIRYKVGWDQWTEGQQAGAMLRMMLKGSKK